MATMNSSVLACRYAISASASSPSSSSSSSSSSVSVSVAPKSQNVKLVKQQQDQTGRRAAISLLAATIFTSAVVAANNNANAGVIEEYLEKSKANKELNDKKRLATSGANFARAYTVEFGTCKFPENFTGCQDLAKQKKVPFISDDLQLECEGKDKYKCGSNVFWKW